MKQETYFSKYGKNSFIPELQTSQTNLSLDSTLNRI